VTLLVSGPQFWPLPCVELEYEVCINQLKWFAQFLLEGAVFSRLKPFVKYLLSPASLMTKQWAQWVFIYADKFEEKNSVKNCLVNFVVAK